MHCTFDITLLCRLTPKNINERTSINIGYNYAYKDNYYMHCNKNSVQYEFPIKTCKYVQAFNEIINELKTLHKILIMLWSLRKNMVYITNHKTSIFKANTIHIQGVYIYIIYKLYIVCIHKIWTHLHTHNRLL